VNKALRTKQLIEPHITLELADDVRFLTPVPVMQAVCQAVAE
jgi:hypothetical protein